MHWLEKKEQGREREDISSFLSFTIHAASFWWWGSPRWKGIWPRGDMQVTKIEAYALGENLECFVEQTEKCFKTDDADAEHIVK